MTDEAMRIAVAEAVGYKWPGLRKEKDTIGWTLNGHYIPRIPNYPASLDAMAEAEKVLTLEQRIEYFYALNDVLGLVDPNSPAWITDLAVVSIACASARQRCIAFLKTLGRYVEPDDQDQAC